MHYADKTTIAQLSLMNAIQLGTILVSVTIINYAVASYDSTHLLTMTSQRSLQLNCRQLLKPLHESYGAFIQEVDERSVEEI